MNAVEALPENAFLKAEMRDHALKMIALKERLEVPSRNGIGPPC